MKIKKILFTCLTVATAGAVMVPFLTSCSNIDQKILDKVVSHGDYNKYSTNVTFDQMVEYAISDVSGQNAIKKAKADQLIYEWYMDKAENNREIKNSISDWNKEIDKAYKENVQSSKDTNKNNWEYYFQNEVLAPAGGYESTYKHAQLVEKMRADFISQVFANNYMGMKNDAGEILNQPTVAQIQNPNNWDQIGFFPETNSKYDKESKGQTHADFAAIQQFVFDAWFKDVDPYVVSMSLWMYSDPRGGLKTVYNDEYISDPTKLDATSYAFPYFQHSTDNVTISGQDKFFEFTKNISNSDGSYNATNSYVKDKEHGGTISIPPRLSDDTSGSTLIVAKSGSIFTDLDTQFAAAAADSLLRAIDPTYKNLTMPLITNLANPGAATAKDQDILRNFLLTTAPAAGTIFNDLAKQYGLNGTTVNLFNPEGKYKDVKYSIDAFLYGSSPFTFIRDTFGVHVIAIDGGAYISDGTDLAARKTKQKEVLLYRAYESQRGFGECGTIDIFTDMTSYFNANMDDLIIQMAAENKVFNTNEKNYLSDAEKSMYESLRKLNAAIALQTSIQTADDKMLAYSQAATTQYGLEASNNGLITRLPYAFDKTNSKYSVVAAFYSSPDTVSNLFNEYKESTVTFLNEGAKIVPNTDTSGMYRFNQTIMATEEGKKPNAETYKANAINSVLTAFGQSDTSNMGNTEKLAAFEKYLAPKDGFNYYNFNTGESDYDKYLASSYFQKNILTAEKPLSYYKYDWSVEEDSSQTNIEAFNALMIKEWHDSRSVGSYKADVLYSNENIAYYTMLSTIKYLSENNYENLRTYLLNEIITPDNPAVLAWTAQDNLKLNPNFGSTTATRSQIYGWKNNPNNIFGSPYQVDAEQTGEIGMHTMFDQYWQNAPMGDSIGVPNNSYMGFMGLQTKSSNSFSSSVSSAVYDKLIFSSPDRQTGVLNAYGSREALITRVEKMTTISDVEKLARRLQELIPSLEIEDVVGVYKPGSTTDKLTLDDKKINLVAIVKDEVKILDKYFDRISFQEINNPLETSSPVIYNDPATSPIGTRTTIYQINTLDVSSTDNWATLCQTFGDEIMMQICIQFSQSENSSLQTLVTNKVIEECYGADKKANVYDIRMNDQLGRVWVKDWKEA